MRRLAILIVFLTVAACAAVDTPQKRLAVGEGMFTAALNTATALAEADAISPDAARLLLDVQTVTEASLEEARRAVDANSPTMDVAVDAFLAAAGQYKALADAEQLKDSEQ